MTGISFAPYLPWWVLAAFTGGIIAASLLRVRSHPTAAILRTLTGLATVAFLTGPQVKNIEGDTQPDIVVVVEDSSRSATFGNRYRGIANAADTVSERLTSEGFDVRRITFGTNIETDLNSAFQTGLADVPRRRLSAAIVISDGQIHNTEDMTINAPAHSFIVGNRETQNDRRVEIVRAPKFGVVGESIQLILRVISENETGTVPSTLYLGGEVYSRQPIRLGEDVSITVPLRQPGETIVELEVAPLSGELTPLNNRAVTSLTAVRDRLRVLLVSGQPHAGERVWRNTLKSDPAVDLVHFTILKPGTKDAGAPNDELNLIEFPHQELFLEKLSSFDVVIFDRYTYRGVLLPFEFEEIARYVERGGAVLISAGPEMSKNGSLAFRPNLGFILPIIPTDEAIERPFVPTLSEVGKRHPVTRSLEDPSSWGRWLRHIPGEVRGGQTLMTATQNMPLLVLNRVRNGRIGVIMSDHAWLWSREFDGGGPYRELLRRMVHWLMQEPELEEESLSGVITASGRLIITRQTLSTAVDPVIVVKPDGTEQTISFKPEIDGVFKAQMAAAMPGRYRLSTQTNAGTSLYALASDGNAEIKELGAVISTTEHLQTLAMRTGGGVFEIGDDGIRLPDFRRVRPTAAAATSDWIGLPRRDVREIKSLTVRPIAAPWLWALLIGGLALLAWLIEGRSGLRRQS